MNISLEEFYRGRDRQFKDELTEDIVANAKDLLTRVNGLLTDLKWGKVSVSSGWRPKGINSSVGGANKSHHISGKAIDLRDPDGKLDAAIVANYQLLDKHGLWLESPTRTPGWVHLDTGKRMARERRIFLP